MKSISPSEPSELSQENGPLLTVPQSRLDKDTREKMRHLRCLCFVRPSPDSIQYLIDEFREPKYGEYHICKR